VIQDRKVFKFFKPHAEHTALPNGAMEVVSVTACVHCEDALAKTQEPEPDCRDLILQ